MTAAVRLQLNSPRFERAEEPVKTCEEELTEARAAYVDWYQKVCDILNQAPAKRSLIALDNAFYSLQVAKGVFDQAKNRYEIAHPEEGSLPQEKSVLFYDDLVAQCTEVPRERPVPTGRNWNRI